MNESRFILLFMLMLRILKKLFIQPFTWFFNLPTRKKILTGFLALFGVGLLLLLIPLMLFFAVSSGMFGKMPSDEELQAIKNYQASEVYSADSVLLGRYFVQNRSDVNYEDVAPAIFNAIIATEDARFYQHTGVDTRSLLRVLFKSVLMRQKTGGGSTLSQQLAKNLFGRKQYGFFSMPVNKIREGIIANQLEKLYSKKEILMLYVNTVSFGENTFGIKTASLRFFNTTPDKIKTEQAAVLAGMLKATTLYNPRKHPENAKNRRNVVLHQMEKYGYLTKEENSRLQKKPLLLKYNRTEDSEGLAPYFREKLKTEVEKWLAQNPKADGSFYNLSSDGLKIYTSLNSKLQKYAEEACMAHLRKIQPALQKDLKARAFFKKNASIVVNAVKQSDRYKALDEEGLSSKEIMKRLQKPDSIRMFTQWGEKTMFLSPVDSVRLRLSTLQVGFLVVDPHTGYVLAWVGGPDYKHFQFDHIMAKRQAGSVFKPIVYAKALQSGSGPCEFMPNQKITYTQYDDWAPQNANEEYKGRYSIAGALANSVNTISVHLCMRSGIKKVIDLAKLMGITSELPATPSIALGAADISLWELTGAYTAFANEGSKSNLQFITSIVNGKGTRIYQSEPILTELFEPGLAHDMTNMLRLAVDRGTAHELRDNYRLSGMIAGKTGTTQEHRDGWFMGYTASFLAGVWVGADNPTIHFSNMQQGRGSAMAMPIWAGFYRLVSQDPKLSYLVKTPFPFENDIDCEMQKEDSFFQKLFPRKNKTNNSTGLEKTRWGRLKRKKTEEN
jgi:penicillin-binding protein 1A